MAGNFSLVKTEDYAKNMLKKTKQTQPFEKNRNVSKRPKKKQFTFSKNKYAGPIYSPAKIKLEENKKVKSARARKFKLSFLNDKPYVTIKTEAASEKLPVGESGAEFVGIPALFDFTKLENIVFIDEREIPMNDEPMPITECDMQVSDDPIDFIPPNNDEIPMNDEPMPIIEYETKTNDEEATIVVIRSTNEVEIIHPRTKTKVSEKKLSDKEKKAALLKRKIKNMRKLKNKKKKSLHASLKFKTKKQKRKKSKMRRQKALLKKTLTKVFGQKNKLFAHKLKEKRNYF